MNEQIFMAIGWAAIVAAGALVILVPIVLWRKFRR